MTKFEWERQLKRGISSLPKGEQQRVLDYYSELFADKIELDMDEQEIIAEFGNPFDVANKLIVNFYSESNGSASNADEYIYSDSKSTSFDEFEDRKHSKSTQRAAERSVSKSSHSYSGNSSAATNKKSTGRAYGVLFSLALLTFFALGAVGLWHPGWTVFLGALVLASLFDAVKRKNPLVFNYPVFVTILFLLLGFSVSWWHPTWILFVTIPLYYTILGGKFKDPDNTDDDIIDDEKPIVSKVQHKSTKEKFVEEKAPQKNQKTSAATIVTAIVLSLVFVYIAIAAWTVVIAFFCGGIGVLLGGLAAIAVAIGQFVYGAATALVILGVGLLLFGLGLIFTIGCASLFKGVSKMCKAMFGSIKKMVKGGAQ